MIIISLLTVFIYWKINEILFYQNVENFSYNLIASITFEQLKWLDSTLMLIFIMVLYTNCHWEGIKDATIPPLQIESYSYQSSKQMHQKEERF